MEVFENLLKRYPQLSVCKGDIEKAFTALLSAFQQQKKLLVAGNGGSAADSGHIAGELLKSFCCKRPIPPNIAAQLPAEITEQLEGTLPVISLPDFVAFHTAYANDRSVAYSFAQLVLALGQLGDVFWAISTSGNSKNILHAAQVARAKSMPVIGLTGQSGGALKSLCDVCIAVPEVETYKIQELHLPIYHALCQALEAALFDGPSRI
ncbi:MAG: SIS domain-containing protein [Verrucomicrobiota bacterium]|nr:MAG: SIS domain-containing protein [Verrucomicrobiota bacterium]